MNSSFVLFLYLDDLVYFDVAFAVDFGRSLKPIVLNVLQSSQYLSEVKFECLVV